MSRGNTTSPASVSSGYYSTTFTSSNLVNKILTVNHGLGVLAVPVVVVDNTNAQIIPDSVNYTDTSNCQVNLTSFTVTGVWKVTVTGGSVEGGGVTGGDAHDHVGGDGAQINHTGLSNIGTNSHATVDTHLAAASPHSAHATLSGGKVPTTELGGSGADATKFLRGDQTWGTASSTRGHISNLVIKNVPSNFDPDTMTLLRMNGTDGSTTFTDATQRHTFTASGNAQIDTAYKKFGTGSGLFDGTGDYLTSPDSDDWNFGTGNFTVDFWYRPATATPSLQEFWTQVLDVNTRIVAYMDWTYHLGFYANLSSTVKAYYLMPNAWSFSANTQYHLAWVRNGTSLKIYIDGISQTLTENTAISTNSMPDIGSTFNIGAQLNTPSDQGYVNGGIDEFRVSKVARWTTDFTPPAAEYDIGSDYTKYQADIDADSIVLYDGTNTKEAQAVDLTVDVTTSGINGLDTGTEAVSTWYYVWVINNGTTTAGLLSISSTAPTMPSGYTYKRLVGAVRNNASSNFLKFKQTNDYVRYYDWATGTVYSAGVGWLVVDNSTATTFTDINCSTYVPAISEIANLGSMTSGQLHIRENGDTSEGVVLGRDSGSAGPIGVDSSKIIEARTAAGGTFSIGVVGYYLNL